MPPTYAVVSAAMFPIIITFFVVYKIVKQGRLKINDEDDIVVAEYSIPEDLTPAEAGAIFDFKVSGRDITAELIHLSIKGYLSIDKVKNNKTEDIALTLLKDPESNIATFEHNLLKYIFLQSDQLILSSLKHRFFAEANEINFQVWNSVVKKGYAFTRPIDYYIKYGLVGALMGGVGFLSLINGNPTFLDALLVFCALIIFIAMKFLQPLTVKGLEARSYLKGLKKYLEIAERQRLLFFSGPNLENFEFDPLVPYALVLGVVPEWATVFGEIYEVSDKTNV